MILKNTLICLALAGFGLSACSSGSETSSSKPQHSEHQRMGSHGMVMLGEADISFYHLALYRRPHDRQILTPAQFANSNDREAFEKWRSSYQDIVTIVPTNFDLDRLNPKSSNFLTSFEADIYQGHFERGGTLKFAKVTFDLSKPVLHRPVLAEDSQDVKYSYVETGETAYLIKDIGRRPGEDRIFKLAPHQSIVSGDRLVMVNANETDKAKFKLDSGTIIEIDATSPIYLETADFQ